jgi:hypothetical protein
MNDPVSSCCLSSVKVQGIGGGTQYYKCAACGEPCDRQERTQPLSLNNLLDEILLQYRAELRQGLNELAGHDPLDQAKASLIDYIDKEIIGENDRRKIRYYDEVEQANVYYADEAGSVRITRNNLRAKQRAKLKGKE